MFRSPVLDEIQRLDAVRDHVRIVFLTTRVDFPFDTTRALELALFRTFAVPSIAGLLRRTGEFENRAQKRYDDTDILISEMLDHGYDSDRGSRALGRMNAIHGRFAISNDDFRYVLSTFVLEPIRFIDRFGWRSLVPAEREAMFRFWREVGARMGIREIPPTLEELERSSADYERLSFASTEDSRRVGAATRELFAGWFPRPLRPLVRTTIHALLDDATRDAFGFPAPGPRARALVLRSLAARRVLLSCLPRRRRPRLRTRLRRAAYPQGYDIDAVGPPERPPEGVRPDAS